ncbi:hypothetical protein L6164_026530 [Bauhinia variegata]|uniref:Uncharacterized protein n=1 Tax=Bauhinia variegata TaxID=167791 RepID=A0ACB9LRY1_BAUVA|nr:hypothetical protein L6164_026530 [Bauhinia variegata]
MKPSFRHFFLLVLIIVFVMPKQIAAQEICHEENPMPHCEVGACQKDCKEKHQDRFAAGECFGPDKCRCSFDCTQINK